jgi:predicted O-linked N-acetylglucosamine transferase (SPINDLY family)
VDLDDVELARLQALCRDGRRAEAEANLRERLLQFPDDAVALRFLAESYDAARRSPESVDLWRRLVAANPGDASLLRQYGNALLACQRLPEAIDTFRSAIGCDASNPRAHNNLGLALLRSGNVDEARLSLEAAVALDPTYAFGYFNLAMVAERIGDVEAARVNYQRALAHNPLIAEAHSRLSVLAAAIDPLRARREFDLATEARATEFMQAQRFDEAIGQFTLLLERQTDLPYVLHKLFHCRLQCADWADYDATAQRIAAGVRDGTAMALPLTFLAHSDSPEEHLLCAKRFADLQFPSVTAKSGFPRPARPTGPGSGTQRSSATSKIRIAYLSADWHDHATAYLIAGMLESHDRDQFDVTALSFGPDSSSPIRGRIETAVERFIDVRSRSDAEVADLIEELSIDIAIDLKGHTHDARAGIFRRRPAPLQINFLGYPGSLGMECIDYLIADRHVIAPAERGHYLERIIYLPDSYQPNDRRRVRPAASAATRALEGLPERGTVFCCFNQTYKISPHVFTTWMSILRSVPDGVLWLFEASAKASQNLHRAAEANSVDPERLVFARFADLGHHLARYRCADLVLDTTPFNAHTTASDALWMGIPVLTVTGRTFAGRVATSLLHAVGMPELACPSLAAYEGEAIRLARSPGAIEALKQRLEVNRLRKPLFDTERYTRHFERALNLAWSHAVAGHAPADLLVESVTTG